MGRYWTADPVVCMSILNKHRIFYRKAEIIELAAESIWQVLSARFAQVSKMECNRSTPHGDENLSSVHFTLHRILLTQHKFDCSFTT